MSGSGDLGSSLSFMGKLVEAQNDPFKRSVEYGVGAVVVGHQCLMFGGYSGGGSKHRIYLYDRKKVEWTTVQPKNMHNRFGSIRMTFILDDILYACTWYQDANLHVFMALDLVAMEEWVPAGKDACPRTGFGTVGSFVEARNEGVLFGGESCSTDVYVYNVERSSWYSPKVSGAPPAPRRNHAACSFGHKLFILGGRLLEGRNSLGLDLHVLTMQGERFVWSSPVVAGQTPRERFLFTAAAARGRIFVYGGFAGPMNFDVYSIKKNCWYLGSQSANEIEARIRFTNEYKKGNANNAMVVADGKLIVLGGNSLPAKTPLEIEPC